MADTKKRNADNTDITPFAVPAELSKDNNNLDENIQPSSLDLLKARYGAIEEDENIKNEGFELAKRVGLSVSNIPKARFTATFQDLLIQRMKSVQTLTPLLHRSLT